ncbi:hypothetical protein BJ508DRAFT_149605 [Ascobolus immersus RN42]|uniref:Calponin-homology (CH) domain-containing protein n=1 Tax=Ascobolus immersus RN42 TaxID=1160509 RepID=A0A3N4IJM2_ASCIM|nr:hypothetical protein BJ508DRAFT_149605 [Ascobolus immersus RN42]
MSRLRQSDFLRTPCPTNNNSLANSKFFEGGVDDLEDDVKPLVAEGPNAPKRPKVIKGKNIFATAQEGANAGVGFTSTSNPSDLAAPLPKPRQSINYVGSKRTRDERGPTRRISTQPNEKHTVEPSEPPAKRVDLDKGKLLGVGNPGNPIRPVKKSLAKEQLGPVDKRKTLDGKVEQGHAAERRETNRKKTLGDKDTNIAPIHYPTTGGKTKAMANKSAKKSLGKIVRKRSLENAGPNIQGEPGEKDNDGEKYMSFRNQLRLIKKQKMASGVPERQSLSSQDGGELMEFPGDIRRPTVARRQSNPIISNDLLNPAMYESSWLAAQESSVQQLLNALFTARLPSTSEHFDTYGLRSQLLKIYSSSPFPLVYRRVQSSLLFGALAPAKDIVSRSSAGGPATILGNKGTKGWGEDLGLRSLFLSLFTETYDINLLSVALEVVVGREMFSGERTRLSEKERKKTIEGYITKFIICCEDLLTMAPPPQPKDRLAKLARSATTDDEDWGTVGWLWRKSVQRALMLIFLLDKAKTERVVKSCLFQPSSEHKTSVSVVHQLSRLLLPSLGDVVRPLSHLNYIVSHTQDPLEEFNYTVDNLAVDLRDGVRLVRAVELLLYPPTSDSASDWYSEDWPLSSHIKFPALGRPQKIYNVSLALRALEEVGGNKGGVSAADVVDGCRERTIGLLLEIMQRWGLGSLVDFDETRREVERLERKVKKRHIVDEEEGEYAEANLLKRWAAAVAELHGLLTKVENLTTSFADGSVFLAIVTEYEQYFPTRHPKGIEETLEKKLRALGCNSYFADEVWSSL